MPRTLMPGAARNASRIQGEYSPRRRRCFWPAISSVTESPPARGTMRNGSASAPAPSTSSLTGPTSDPSRCWPERRSGQRLPPSNARPSSRVLNSVKLPCVPRRSGVHIAESKRPLNSSGGKVMGTRRTVLPMECSPRIFQKVWLLRSISTVGRQSGMRRRPIRRRAPRRAHPAGGEFRNVGFEAAVEKIENIVLGRAHPGGKGGPRHRRERRERGAQPVKRPLFLQAAQIRQFALGHEALGEPRIEPVEAQKNETLDFGPAETSPAAEHRASGAKRPEQKRAGGEKERRDQA